MLRNDSLKESTTIRVDVETHQKIKVEAARQRVTVKCLIGELVTAAVEKVQEEALEEENAQVLASEY